MASWRQFLLATAVVSAACAATAQSEPSLAQNSISAGQDPTMMTTRDAPAAKYQQKNPFGRGEAGKMAAEPVIPSGPHVSVAVPVVDVDELEASEPAPPTPTAPEADPVQEDPAQPTDLTSPMFEEEVGVPTPRKIILRALNKVTAQSELLALKPNETAQFGQLAITAVTCRVSSPTSQTDYAALLDISEKSATTQELKPLFRGWMYASSPSIAALEHPVYDVTMVECAAIPPAPKKDEKPAGKPTKATPAAKTAAPTKDAGRDGKKGKN